MKKILKRIFFIVIFLFFILYLIKTFLLTHSYQEKYYNEDKKEKDIVVTFHGIYGREKQLRFINESLAKNGYSVVNIQYPTVDDRIEEMVDKYIAPVIENQIEKLNKINAERKYRNLPELKINFVVHSMGSVLLRYYLENNKLKNLGKVVLISPPSHGSHLSDNIIADIFKFYVGPAVAELKTNKKSFVNQLENPIYPCYVLIGNKSINPINSFIIKGKDDGMVPIETARLDGASFKIIKNTTHTTILKSQETVDEILEFLK